MSPEIALFNLALGLTPPWQVVNVRFDAGAKELHLYVDFPQGSRFPCPECGGDSPVYDAESDRVWRHLNFFEHKTFLHARFPRIQCSACGVKTVEGSWARPGSGFTLLFEAFALLLCKQMPPHAAASLLGEYDTRLWRLVEAYVEPAVAARDMSRVRSVKVDETARSRGHEYLTLFADGDKGDVLLVTPGKDAATVSAFARDLVDHGGKTAQITSFSQDMSPAFESGVSRSFPDATQVVDRFHVVKLANDAVDKVRRQEVRKHPELKKSRYLWLKNPQDLSAAQKQTLDDLCRSKPDMLTVRAYHSKLALQKLWEAKDHESAAAYLEQWCAKSEDILGQLTATIRNQAERILNYFTTGKVTNGMMEGINSIVQSIKARARGFRNDRYFSNIIYLNLGNLCYPLPTLNSE